MTSLLQGALAKTIAKSMGPIFYEATVVRETPGGGPGWNPGAPTQTSYACKGMVDTYSAYERQNLQIQGGDVKILLLAATLSIEPTTADKVVARGVTYAIVDVSTDPARAVWTLQART